MTIVETPIAIAKRPRIGTDWTIHCDGATLESNPSDTGGWGFAVFADSALYYAEHGQLVGEVTNQMAEITAINRAVMWCVRKALSSPTIYSDSQVAINVLRGESTLRNQRLQRMEALVRHSMQFINPTFEHVLRGHPLQKLADFTANLGNHGERSYSSAEQRTALLGAYGTWK